MTGAFLEQDAAIDLRLESCDWTDIQKNMDRQGWSVLSGLLPVEITDCLALLWDSARFRSRIIMERYAFGRGEYRYFTYPLPPVIQTLRHSLYPHLAVIANRWNRMLGMEYIYPAGHAEFLARCHAEGQSRPTPLMLNYKESDYCCLHQDLYGPVNFPIQAVALLTDAFTGGELVLTHQGRDEFKADVVPLRRGDIVLFAVNERPTCGRRGYVRVKMRHGVSEIRSGHRRTLGIIFHDAR